MRWPRRRWHQVAYHPTTQTLATTSDDGTFKVWELGEAGEGTLLLEGNGHSSWIGGACLSLHGEIVLLGHE